MPSVGLPAQAASPATFFDIGPPKRGGQPELSPNTLIGK
jgi:hypothetical protein